MDYIHDFFSCQNCQNKDFKRIYNFSLRFHSVNFSDELIYDKLTNELYQCTKCNKTYTVDQIEEGLVEIKAGRRRRDVASD